MWYFCKRKHTYHINTLRERGIQILIVKTWLTGCRVWMYMFWCRSVCLWDWTQARGMLRMGGQLVYISAVTNWLTGKKHRILPIQQAISPSRSDSNCVFVCVVGVCVCVCVWGTKGKCFVMDLPWVPKKQQKNNNIEFLFFCLNNGLTYKSKTASICQSFSIAYTYNI